MRTLLSMAVCCTTFACAHGPTNEQRIEAVTHGAAVKPAGELRCRDTSAELRLARDGAAARSERLQRYASVLAEVAAVQDQLEEAARREPDLIYGPAADAWLQRQRDCVSLATALQRERAVLELRSEDAPALADAPKEKEGSTPARPAAKRRPAAAKADAAWSEDDDASALRTSYKKSVKVAKAKAKRRHLKVAAR